MRRLIGAAFSLTNADPARGAAEVMPPEMKFSARSSIFSAMDPSIGGPALNPATREPRRFKTVRVLALMSAATVVALGALAGIVWYAFGDLDLSTNGYIALTLGAIGTAIVCVGLMFLVFFSAESGYDDEVGKFPKRAGRK